MKDFIRLTTPVGSIAIEKQKICAVASSDDPNVNVQIYLDEDSEPFNIIEDFETVCELMGC